MKFISFASFIAKLILLGLNARFLGFFYLEIIAAKMIFLHYSAKKILIWQKWRMVACLGEYCINFRFPNSGEISFLIWIHQLDGKQCGS